MNQACHVRSIIWNSIVMTRIDIGMAARDFECDGAYKVSGGADFFSHVNKISFSLRFPPTTLLQSFHITLLQIRV